MKNVTVIALVGVISFYGCTTAQPEKTQTQFSATEFFAKVKQGKDVQLVDVRTPEEFKTGHIENAINVDWSGSSFEEQIALLDKSKPVFVYCLSGGRSSSAAKKMRRSGFEHVFEMPGGMMEWRNNRLPIASTLPVTDGLTVQEYEAVIKSDTLVLIDFYAKWCAPCRKMEPYLEKIAVEMADKVKLVRIDADQHAALCAELNVTALPVLRLYKNSQLIWENEGFLGDSQIREQINKASE